MKKSNSMISFITLGVTDLSVMHQFYNGLGFNLYKQSKSNDHPYVMYKSGTVVLALYPKHLLAKQAGCTIEDSDRNGAMSLSLNVENQTMVDHYLSEVEPLGGEVTRASFEPAWGGYCGYFKDPENNLWEVVWNENFCFRELGN